MRLLTSLYALAKRVYRSAKSFFSAQAEKINKKLDLDEGESLRQVASIRLQCLVLSLQISAQSALSYLTWKMGHLVARIDRLLPEPTLIAITS